MNLTDIIRDPGKFEGEPAYVRDVLSPMILDGAADETIDDGDTPISVFRLSRPLRENYGLGPDAYAILVWERDDGFVVSRVVTQARYDRIVNAIDAGETGDETGEPADGEDTGNAEGD